MGARAAGAKLKTYDKTKIWAFRIYVSTEQLTTKIGICNGWVRIVSTERLENNIFREYCTSVCHFRRCIPTVDICICVRSLFDERIMSFTKNLLVFWWQCFAIELKQCNEMRPVAAYVNQYNNKNLSYQKLFSCSSRWQVSQQKPIRCHRCQVRRRIIANSK